MPKIKKIMTESECQTNLLSTFSVEFQAGKHYTFSGDPRNLPGIVKRPLKKEDIMTTPQHCPGFRELQHLKSFSCKCPNCGKEKEIFSDEFNRTHVCRECGKEIDFTKCALEGEA